MSLLPIVRYLIPCHDVQVDRAGARSINILGLLTTIRVPLNDDGPFYFSEMCVLAILTAVRGTGQIRISCWHDESDAILFATSWRDLPASADPLLVVPILFRIREFSLPQRGYFSLRLEYNQTVMAECPINVK